MYDSRTSLSNEVRADIEQFLANARGSDCAWSEAQILPVVIRRNIKLAEAPSYGKTIYEYEENCHGSEDYLKVAEFFSSREIDTAEPLQACESEPVEEDVPRVRAAAPRAGMASL